MAMVIVVLILLTDIIANVRIVDAGYCRRSYRCSYHSYRTEKYSSIVYSIYRKVLVTNYKTCYRRICCSGYNGPSCVQAICYGSTSCPNGGTCSLPDKCSCRPGFGGSGCKDINECLVSNGGCHHICNNSFGSYQCKCRNGFYLKSNGKTCLDIIECSKNNGECNQHCRNLDGSYNCFCKDGFNLAKDGKNCEDINECLGITCFNNGSCVNFAGSYACQCNHGYSGDVCKSDINECLLSNDTCDDQCINTNGSFYCTCNGDSRSLSGDGVSCIVHVKDKSYNRMTVGLGTGISLAFVVVVVLCVAILKTRQKKETEPTSHRYQQTQIGNSGVRTINNENYENVMKPEESENNRSMNEYEPVVVKEVVKVTGETVGQISSYDNIQIKGISQHNGQQRPDRETAEYENLVIFRK